MPQGLLSLDVVGLDSPDEPLIITAVLWPDGVLPVPPKHNTIKWIRDTALGVSTFCFSGERRQSIRRLKAAALVMRRCLEHAAVRHGPCDYKLTHSRLIHRLAVELTEHTRRTDEHRRS